MEKIWFLLLIVGLLFLLPIYATFILSGRLAREEERIAQQLTDNDFEESPNE